MLDGEAWNRGVEICSQTQFADLVVIECNDLPRRF
jgi:hypothetical protein